MLDVIVAMAESDCESLRPGWLGQPANALSSLAFVAAAIWLWARARRTGTYSGAGRSGILALLGVGLGSLAYHGPQPSWAGPVHDASVITLGVLVVGRSVWRFARPGTRPPMVAAWRAALPWGMVAAPAWLAGTSDSMFCHPASILQPHAAWHLFSAVALAVLLGHQPEFAPTGTPATRRKLGV